MPPPSGPFVQTEGILRMCVYAVKGSAPVAAGVIENESRSATTGLEA